MTNTATEILKALESWQNGVSPKIVAKKIGSDAETFRAIVMIFLKEHHRFAQRAANVLVLLAREQPSLFESYFGKLISASEKQDARPVIRRNVVRLLQEIDVPRRLCARAFSHCVELVGDPAAETAVRAFAMTAAARIGRTEPALLNELKLIVEQHLPYEHSPSFRRRAAKILQSEQLR